MVELTKPKLILLDIEGTTTSISFVKEFLFPYVRNNLNQYLTKNRNESHLSEDIKQLAKQSVTDVETGLADVPVIDCNQIGSEDITQSVIDNVLWQMSADRKTTALKQFQGNVWRFGYESGHIKGHVYNDVPIAMNKWKNDLGIRLSIYSSGSVLAQKLLFSYSLSGDLSNLIDNYFDTNVGPKIESLSYKKIANTLNLDPKDILFLTDVAKEAFAAKNAGLNAVLSIRDGTEPLTEEAVKEFPIVTSFNEIQFK